MCKSLGEYIRAVARWWWIVTGGVILSIAGAVQSVGGLTGGPVWVWAILAFAGLAIAQFLAFHESRKELGASKEELVGLQAQIDKLKAQPELDIVFRDEESFKQIQSVRSNRGTYTETLFRVGIQHTGMATVDRVAVELKTITPLPPTLLGMPLPLHVMNYNTPETQYRSDFPLDAAHTQFVDVVFKRRYDGQPASDHIFIYHAVYGVDGRIPAGRYEIVLRTHGQDVAQKEKNFIIDVGDEGALQFEEAVSSS